MRERALATVLFTDIVGSTERLAELGDRAWQQVMERHDACVRRCLRRHGGREVNTTGDGFVALFDRPGEAIACALDVKAEVETLDLEVRAGIHTGECEISGGSINGIAVHVAARVAGAAGGGELLVTSTVKDLVAGGDVEFRSKGPVALKGLRGRRTLYAVLGGHGASRSPARRRRSSEAPGHAMSTSRERSKMSQPAVILVDDHPLWRRTLRQLLEDGGDVRVVGEAGTADEAIVLAQRARPDVVVLDLDMPGRHGTEAIGEIVGDTSGPRVLVLSSSDERGDVLRALRAGAHGYLLKTADETHVLDAIKRVHDGEVVFPPALSAVVLSELRDVAAARLSGGDDEAQPLARLTPRERQILELMADGLSNQAIARTAHVSAKTVEANINSIFTKLGLEHTSDDHRRVKAVVAYLEAQG